MLGWLGAPLALVREDTGQKRDRENEIKWPAGIVEGNYHHNYLAGLVGGNYPHNCLA
jgi:hypothetical protein